MSSKLEQYNRSVLDIRKIQTYAHKVAKEAAHKVPMETHQEYVTIQREEVQRTGWFSKKNVTISERRPQGQALRYWELGRVVTEQFRRRDGLNAYGYTHHIWTGVYSGKMIILTGDGELHHIEQMINERGSDYPALLLDSPYAEWKIQAMQPNSYLLLDYPNLGRMRDKTYSRKEGLLYMEKMQLNFRLTVHQKGLGLSRALNHLMNAPDSR